MPTQSGSEPDNEALTAEQGTVSPKGILRYRKVLIILAHLGCFCGALLLAFLFAFDMQLLRKWAIYQFPILLCVAIPVKLIIFARFKQYQGWWRYVGLGDLLQIAKASLLSTIVLVVLWYCYGIYGKNLIPESAISKLNQTMEQLQIDSERALSRNEETNLRRKYENLKGLRNIIEVSQTRELSKKIEQLPINSRDREELRIRLAELRRAQRHIEGVLRLDLFTTVVFLSALRMLIRLYHEEFFSDSHGTARRFLIVGAGNAGEAPLRQKRAPGGRPVASPVAKGSRSTPSSFRSVGIGAPAAAAAVAYMSKGWTGASTSLPGAIRAGHFAK